MYIKLIAFIFIVISPSLYCGWDGLDRGGKSEEAMKLVPNIENGKKADCAAKQPKKTRFILAVLA